jgi:hypothetical protein
VLECLQVAHLKPKVNGVVYQALGHMVRHVAKATTFVEAFCRFATSDQTYPRIRSARLGALAVAGVFLIDVTSEEVYGNFGSNNLRDLHPTL